MKPAEPQPGSEWIVGGGGMGQLIRAMDWSATPLGSIASWPQSLRTTVNLCLASDLPICLIWGAELVQIYNDGYRVICGGKHPRSMGQNFQECWREAWPVIGAAHDSARAGDTAFLEDQHIFLERHGYVEETFFTFSFSPIRDETGRLAGLFHPVIETTSKMLGERRTRTLRDLASRTSEAKSMDEAFALSTRTLAEHSLDVPFLLIYRREETEQTSRLVAATGLAAGANGAPELVAHDARKNVSWPLAPVFHAGTASFVDDVAARFGKISAGSFPEAIESAVLLPIAPPGAELPVAVVVAGISARLKSTEMYRVFHDLLAGAITTAVANASAYEQERQRAEALAEIDRAKTMFFSNVSHELRTPLTLMLGPTEELLALPPGVLPAEARVQLDVVHRNSLRLQKLVNSLLDFSRLEAGRIQASYEPTDLAALTGDLASVFRSAIEKAGLQFTVDCPPLPEPVQVDRDMWEKIVLNLISNAFKFTMAGEIEVAQKMHGGSVQLCVRDTGSGIAAEELPRVFERFHRVAGAVSRTHEGTGIGLALVQELMKLHGGTVRVDSARGKGSVFTVTMPTGTAHLPPERLSAGRTQPSTATGAAPFVEEASRWLPEELIAPELAVAAARAGEGAPRIVIADDNADMRDYVRRLLAPQFHVVTAPDGQAALDLIAQHLPDLVITDVMMPRLDGFGLVQRLRADPATRALPVIMLSARAGEEARVEGIQSGADDYLIKPFSARELLARVESQLKLVAMRRESGEKMRELNGQLEQRVTELQQARRAALNPMQDAVRTTESLARADRSKDEFLAMLAHELRNPLAPLRNASELLNMGGASAEESAHAQRIIARQIENMSRMIDDLLDVSRITEGKISLRKMPVSLETILTAATSLARSGCAAHHQELSVSFPDAPIYLDADATRLEQVFGNLLNNACKYSGDGCHIALSAEVVNSSSSSESESGEEGGRLRGRGKSREVLVRVSDDGAGIDPAFLPHIFGLFVQASRTLDRAHGGLGIGLTLVQRLVKLHGGTIEARSEGLGHGAEFIVRLPILAEGPPAPAPPPPPEQETPRRILIVDDNTDSARSLAALQKRRGHETHTAFTGHEAITAAAEFLPNVVLLDIGLPGMDGFEVARQLRAMPALRGVFIIAMSGYGREEDRAEAKAAGFDEYMVKPVDLDQLRAWLRERGEKEAA